MIVIVWVAVLPAASLTWKVTALLPVPVGVPVTAPVLPLKVSPKGSVPDVMDQVNGPVPPDTVNVAL